MNIAFSLIMQRYLKKMFIDSELLESVIISRSTKKKNLAKGDKKEASIITIKHLQGNCGESINDDQIASIFSFVKILIRFL